LKLDISTGLAVIGVIATVVLGVWSVSLAIKRRYPGQITFFTDDSISLFDDIVRNLPNLAVLYKGGPVSQNLVLFKGILVNTGIVDITPAMVEQRLSIGLLEGYKWLEARIGSSSESVQADVNVIDESSLVFDTGLFRCNEYIRFEALAEVPLPGGDGSEHIEVPNMNLRESLNFTHRIANTRKVAQQSLDHPNLFGLLMLGLFVFTFAVLLIIGGLPSRQPTMEITYLLKTDRDRTVEVRIEPRSDGTLQVRGVNDEYNETVSPSEFFSTRQWDPRVVVDSRDKWVLRFVFGFVALWLTVMITLFVRNARGYVRGKKWRKLLEPSRNTEPAQSGKA
jgi:hypothetical protein